MWLCWEGGFGVVDGWHAAQTHALLLLSLLL
jgi:hypothetical protein